MSETEIETGIRRSKDGRPYIFDVGRGKEVLYTRASTFAKTLSEGAALNAWKQRMAYLGLNPGMLGATEREQIDTVIAMAMDAAGANDRAKWGTSLHGLTDWVDRGEQIRWETLEMPADLMAGLDRYVEVTKDLDPVEVERFVVNDTLKCAGTFDRIFRLPDGRLVLADLKTGSTLRMLEHAIQLAAYGIDAFYYDPASGARTGPVEVDQTVALIVHVPADPSEGDARLVWVDIRAGWEMALLARQVRASRSRKFEVPAPSWGQAVSPEEGK